jgi:hypothetical protein
MALCGSWSLLPRVTVHCQFSLEELQSVASLDLLPYWVCFTLGLLHLGFASPWVMDIYSILCGGIMLDFDA